MWEAVSGLPEQVEQAAVAAAEVARAAVTSGALAGAEHVTNVVALGMGGSGIGHDLLAAFAAPLMSVPVVVVKDYDVPAFVGAGSLVFASSYSGNTEETLEAVTRAYERGARIVTVTSSSGGRLDGLAAGWDAVRLRVPADLPHPRAAFGSLAVSPLVVLEEIGLVPGVGAALAATVAQLRARRADVAGARARASLPVRVATAIGRTIPLIHGGGPLGAVAAARWKTEINENAKSPAFASVQPELCHNEITGWGQHGDATRQLITLVNLRHAFEHPQVARRFAPVAELMREVVADVIELRAAGEGPLAQLFDLVFLGSLVSLEMAAREGIDPGPIPIVEELKAALSGA